MENENKNFSVEGNSASENADGVVSGEIEGGETQEEMLKRQERMALLEELQEKYRKNENITRIFEDASTLTSTTERLDMVIDGLNELARDTEAKGGIMAKSKRRRISEVINKLRELL